MKKFICSMVVFFVLLYCNCGEPVTSDIPCQLKPGDIIITEFLVNPDGDDQGKEWFEIANISFQPVQLNNLIIEISTADESHTFHFDPGNDFWINKNEHITLASSSLSINPDIRYSEQLGLLNNRKGSIRLICYGRVIDEVIYGYNDTLASPQPGSILSLDPQAYGYLENDKPSNWCSHMSTELTTSQMEDEKSSTSSATPGAINQPCPSLWCLDDSYLRKTVSPQKQDLIISEIYADPPGSDGDGQSEWIELYVAADHALDLNHMQIISMTSTSRHESNINAIACLTVQPQDFIIIAGNQEKNGQLPRIDAVMEGNNLYNPADGVSLAIRINDIIIDSVPYEQGKTQYSISYGHALDQYSSYENDHSQNWCLGIFDNYFDGFGSPGIQNPECGIHYCPVNQTWQIAQTPSVGNIVITELFTDPQGGDGDGSSEWIELYNNSDHHIDLYGLTIQSKTPSAERLFTIEGSDCAYVDPQSYAIIAGNKDFNSTLPFINGIMIGSTLHNGGDGYYIALYDQDMLLDMVPNLKSVPGTSISYMATVSNINIEQNDNPDKWTISSQCSNNNASPGSENCCHE